MVSGKNLPPAPPLPYTLQEAPLFRSPLYLQQSYNHLLQAHREGIPQ